LAISPDGEIVIAGESNVLLSLSPTEKTSIRWGTTDAPIRCLAIGGENHEYPGQVYVATTKGIEVYDPLGERETTWPLPGEGEKKAHLTAIAPGDYQDVFLADSASRAVWRYNTSGEVVGKIGHAKPGADEPGFLITKPQHFDLAVAPDGLIRAVNPRRLRIEAFTPDGSREFFWGTGGDGVAAFYGCCNPAHLAIFPDGRFATLDKGRFRMKVYSSDGTLEGVVADETRLATMPIDLAVTPEGDVLSLEQAKDAVRLIRFRPKVAEETLGAAESESTVKQ